MRILVNGAPQDVAGRTLDAVLVELGYAQRRIATALDGDFVPAARRGDCYVREDSRVEIVAPMQGG